MTTNVPRIDFWSYSSLTTHETCPYQTWLGRIAQEPRPERGEDHPINRGTRVHQGIEDYIKGKTEHLIEDAKRYRPLVEELREAYVGGTCEVEASWWFDSNWNKSSYNSTSRWLVVKTDIAQRLNERSMLIADWKTGKSFMKDVKHGGQMQLYAASAFMRYPELETVSIRLPYLDEAPPGKMKNYVRPQVVPFINSFTRRATQMLEDVEAGRFPPKPNKSNCKYCDFGSANGTGVCVYGVES